MNPVHIEVLQRNYTLPFISTGFNTLRSTSCISFQIKKSLREQLNLIYSKFINRNPDFLTRGGKISVISHSLGSVIFHDILINWNDQLIDEHKQQADKNIATEGRWSWIWGSRRRKQPSESIDETAQQSDEYSALQERLRQAKEDVADLEAKIFAGKSTANTDTQCSERGHDFSLGFKVLLKLIPSI